MSREMIAECRFIRAVLDEVIFELKCIQCEAQALKKGFNPNQPRVPAGSPDGGEWTDGSNPEGGTGLNSGNNGSVQNIDERWGPHHDNCHDKCLQVEIPFQPGLFPDRHGLYRNCMRQCLAGHGIYSY